MTDEVKINSKVGEVLAKYPMAGRDKLIPILQQVQELDGYLSKEAVILVGQHLDLPTSKIFGVATFYNQFRFKPFGKYHIQVCRGTACHVKGSATVLDILEKELAVPAGETTRDGMFSIEVVACIGACGLAPVIAINGEFYANVTGEGLRNIIKSYRDKEGENE